MLTEDYLMRWIRLVTAALARMVGLKTAGLYTDAIFLLDRTLEQIVGLPAELLRKLDDTSLLDALSDQDGVDPVRAGLVADLLKEEGDIYAQVGESAEAHLAYQRALMLYLEAALGDVPENAKLSSEKVETLAANLENTPLPPEICFSLFYYTRQVKNYSRAFAAMQALLASNNAQNDLIAEARAFYKELCDLSSAELQQAGLSKQQIDDAMSALPAEQA
jgi:hypothetical protein